MNIQDKISYSEGGITSKVILSEGKIQVTLFSMAAGTSIGDHTTTKEGHVHVVEGKGTFTLEKEPIEMKPGVLISLKNNALHSLDAEENTTFLLFLTE